MQTSNLLDAESKTLDKRMLKEVSEDLNNIKKDQSETKDTPIEMKNNLQRISGRVDEVKNQISDLGYKEAKNTQSEQSGEK